MAELIYMTNMSLDGYCEDRDGGIDLGAPDEEYFGFINDLERSVGTYLYGRRMYEAMIYWETAPIADQPSWVVDFTNIWRAADKIVFSKTLASVSSDRTTLEREFNVASDSADEGSSQPTTSRWAELISLLKRLGGLGGRVPLVHLANRAGRRQTRPSQTRASRPSTGQ